jgi:AraC-like DNA-binding protein
LRRILRYGPLDRPHRIGDNSNENTGGEMRRDDSEISAAHSAVYAELLPVDRHRWFVDHLFVLRDRGRLTGVGRNLFASPFTEIALVGQPVRARGSLDEVFAWKAFRLPPRFGRQPRQRSFHGWMLGIRYRPLDLDVAEAALAGMSERFAAAVEDIREDPFDAIVGALDACIDHLSLRFNAAPLRAAPRDTDASRPDRDTRVAALAAAAGVVPRTLQRHFHNRTGLAPKRYAAVQRLNGALNAVALERGSLAHIASDAGYCDQAHLTTEMGRHTGLSPGQFRAMARQQIVPHAVRFFKDAELRNRLRLLVCDSGSYDPGATDDEAIDDEIRSKGCKL